jgi:hypothetical protein
MLNVKHIFLLCVLISTASVLVAYPGQTARRKIVCKTPENANHCYWTHGRLSLYNGGPPNLRLWKIGTHRLLGIYSGPGFGPLDPGFTEEDDVELPANLSKYDYTKVSIFGDFEVCPLAPEQKRRMQPVCIESAKRLVIGKSDF